MGPSSKQTPGGRNPQDTDGLRRSTHHSLPEILQKSRVHSPVARQVHILMQLRTGHAPVFSHLHRIGHSDTPECPQESCNHTTEDIHHLFFICPTYTQPRYCLIRNLGRNKFSLSKLLADAKVILHTIAFINSTSRFKHIFRDIGDCEGSLLH